jgi:hypothetical protein
MESLQIKQASNSSYQFAIKRNSRSFDTKPSNPPFIKTPFYQALVGYNLGKKTQPKIKNIKLNKHYEKTLPSLSELLIFGFEQQCLSEAQINAFLQHNINDWCYPTEYKSILSSLMKGLNSRLTKFKNEKTMLLPIKLLNLKQKVECNRLNNYLENSFIPSISLTDERENIDMIMTDEYGLSVFDVDISHLPLLIKSLYHSFFNGLQSFLPCLNIEDLMRFYFFEENIFNAIDNDRLLKLYEYEYKDEISYEKFIKKSFPELYDYLLDYGDYWLGEISQFIPIFIEKNKLLKQPTHSSAKELFTWLLEYITNGLKTQNPALSHPAIEPLSQICQFLLNNLDFSFHYGTALNTDYSDRNIGESNVLLLAETNTINSILSSINDNIYNEDEDFTTQLDFKNKHCLPFLENLIVSELALSFMSSFIAE